jgi:hypothetical protein
MALYAQYSKSDKKKLGTIDIDVSPNLSFSDASSLRDGLFGRRFSLSYKADGGPPQHPSNDAEKPFAGLYAEKRELRSTISAMLCLLFASSWRGWRFAGGLIAAYAIFGLLLRIDVWNLAIRIL